MSYFQRLLVGTDRNFATIEVDAVISEQYDLTSQITSSPVDFGSEVADHIINDPRTYQIEAVVTDTPMAVLAALQAIGNNARAALNYLTSSITGGEAEAPATARSVAAFQSLVALWESKAVINIQTGMGLMENLAIQHIRVLVDVERANHLRFTAALKQVNRVYVQVVGDDTYAPGPVQESAAPVKREGLKHDIQETAESVQAAIAGFFS